ncbi:DUF1365 domain-containing protein [Collimonas pratensis]|uniref:Cyclopropane fatty acid synthase n=1 Tax=Collimonas pratensis TaxID=279113 RepID=A0A127Q7D1_9BURK|nr:DUF1365 domain-containing protein [Collimonas pratensis]AMP05969.1 hypothetical protein CPter91_3648 [Collimonas pratensis]
MQSSTSNALLIRGQVMHERLRPAHNRFVYPVFYLRLNLSQLNQHRSIWFGVDCKRPVSLRTRDYGARDGTALITWIRNLLAEHEITADGEIWLQTFPRIFGFVFNPVSFWYCYDQHKDLRAVLAEVNNTFGETHRYLLTADHEEVITSESTLSCQKRLHVSPFCPLRGSYYFRFRDGIHTTFTGIDYHDDDGLLLKTSIGGHIQPLQSGTMLTALLKQPFLTLGIVGRIHWQALKLWLKRVSFFHKPQAPLQDTSLSISIKKERSS